MARTKVKLEWMRNYTARRQTYRKRTKGLLKKASELNVLCGIDTCVVLYSPFDNKPEIWPNQVGDVQQILTRVDEIPEIERNKNMVNLDGYLREKITKAQNQIRKVATQVQELETSKLLFDCMRGKELTDITDENTIRNLIWLADNKLSMGTYRLGHLRDEQPPQPTNDAAMPPSGQDEDLLEYPSHMRSYAEDMGHAYAIDKTQKAK